MEKPDNQQGSVSPRRGLGARVLSLLELCAPYAAALAAAAELADSLIRLFE